MKFLNKIKSIFLKEASMSDVYGQPIDFNLLNTYNGMPLNSPYVWGRDLYPDRASTVRNKNILDSIRQYCRLLYETNPNAYAVISGLSNYVIGSGLSIKIEPKDAKTGSVRTVTQTQKVVDDFVKENKLDEWYDEVFTRFHRDGEVFLRLFPAQDGSYIRAIEPDYIQAPAGSNADGEWSFGIKTLEFDSQSVLAYNITYREGQEEVVDAQFIHHLKNNVNKNVKRGLSSLYATMDELKGADSLRETASQGERVRQAIAYIRQFATAPQSAVMAMNETAKTTSMTMWGSDNASQEVNIQKVLAGSVCDIPKGLEMKDPPSIKSPESSNAIINESLNAVAARFGCPQWLVSGSATDSSYASATVSESPFVKNCLKQQRIQCEFWKSIINDIIEIEMSKGTLAADTLDKVKITIVAPSPIARASKEQVDAQLALVGAKVMSKHSLATLNNLDLADEVSKQEEEAEIEILKSDDNSSTAQDGKDPKTMNGQMANDVEGK